MTDHPMTTFEQRFASRLRAYGDIDVAPIDEHAIARAAATAARPSFGLRLPVLRPATRLLIAAALVAAAVGTVVVGAGMIPPSDPSPTSSPSPTRPRSTSPFPALSDVGPMINLRQESPAAVQLADSRILIVHPALREVEIWDPRTGAFQAAGERPFAGSVMLARLGDGRVLMAGSRAVDGYDVDSRAILLYDPATQTFEDAPDAALDRGWCHCGVSYAVMVRPSLFSLPDGRAMLVGGQQYLPGKGEAGPEPDTAEIYDPVTNDFTSIPTRCNRGSRGTHGILPGPTRALGDIHPGYVLLTCLDGTGNQGMLFDLETDTFSRTDDPTTTNGGATFGGATFWMFDGRLLLTGDAIRDGGSRAEWYSVGEGFSQLPTEVNPGPEFNGTVLGRGRVLFLGDGAQAPLLFEDAPTSFPFRETSLAPLTADYTLVWLGDDRVLALGPLGAAYVLDRTLIP